MKRSEESLILLAGVILVSILFIFGYIAPAQGSNYDLSIQLNQGWNLLSLPRWASEITFQEEANILALLAFREGKWEVNTAWQEDLNNPATAVFIKVNEPTIIRFKWSEITPHKQFASVRLTQGWNLIGNSIRTDYTNILASVIDRGTGGITHIYAPNTYNARKEAGYHLPWPDNTIDLTDNRGSQTIEMYPLDGYWVYLLGSDVNFSTPVDERPVEKWGQ